MSRPLSAGITFRAALFSVLFLSACAEIPVRLNTIPSAPPTNKLRVYVQPHTSVYEGRGKWGPQEKFEANQIRLIKNYLAETGIYELVDKKDEQAVLGDQRPWISRMERNDWALAREIGSALHADYVMVLERGTNGILNTQYFLNMLINVETGKKFGVQYSFTRIRGNNSALMKNIMLASYRDIFRDAKEDLLATAIRKSGRVAARKETVAAGPAPVKEPEPTVSTSSQAAGKRKPAVPQTPPDVQEPKPAADSAQKTVGLPEPAKEPEQAVNAAAKRDWVKNFDAENVLTEETAVSGRKRLVVYDLAAQEQYKPAALILTEALREELFRLKQYTLVNRENLQQVLQEMALQQTGLIDEKQAVETGKGLAANQVVTGSLGLFGKTYVLQAKRIDVRTFETLGLTSARFREGQEEDVLSKMPDLAKGLSGLK
jgi:hypothetical protein